MVRDLDVYRTANLLIRQLGDDAQAEAERRAADMQQRGRQDGAAVWCRIAAAIDVLQSERTARWVH